MSKQMWGINTMKYYSNTKKNETIPFTATWMNLEIPNGSQVRQKEKTNIQYIWKHTHPILTYL